MFWNWLKKRRLWKARVEIIDLILAFIAALEDRKLTNEEIALLVRKARELMTKLRME